MATSTQSFTAGLSVSILLSGCVIAPAYGPAYGPEGGAVAAGPGYATYPYPYAPYTPYAPFYYSAWPGVYGGAVVISGGGHGGGFHGGGRGRGGGGSGGHGH